MRVTTFNKSVRSMVYRAAFKPSYGIAEATSLVAPSTMPAEPTRRFILTQSSWADTRRVVPDAPNAVARVVGHVACSLWAVIVDLAIPASRRAPELPDGEIGEVCC